MKPPKKETVVFAGFVYTRYPRSKARSNRKYFRRISGGKLFLLHREVWKSAHGRDIPDGHHVHHKDTDTLNNDIGNLELMSPAAHASHHTAGRPLSPAHRAKLLAGLERIKGWHSTPKGLAYHRRAALEFVAAQPTIELKCVACGKVRRVKAVGRHIAGGSPYCSNNCRYAAGADLEDRTCHVCGKGFRAVKWRRADATCSRSCANRARKMGRPT